MGFLDRLLGREEPQRGPQYSANRPSERSDDQIAVERYRYLLRTAPPETIEQVHTEAFSRLTPQQRDLLFQQLSEDANASERPRDNAPASLAQAATRQELRSPGTMERTLGSAGQRGGGMGFGGTFASSLLGTVTGFVIGSAIASAFLPDAPAETASADGGAEDPGADGGAESDAGADSGGDFGGDAGGGDFGGGFGDFGGGDFGF